MRGYMHATQSERASLLLVLNPSKFAYKPNDNPIKQHGNQQKVHKMEAQPAI